jgi:iron complex outermembrane recepter protein
MRPPCAAVSGTVGRTGYLVSAGRMDWDHFRVLIEDTTRTYGAADRKVVNARLIVPVGSGTLRLTGLAMDQFGENPGALPRDSILRDRRWAWPANVRARTGEGSSQQQLGASWIGRVGSSLDAEGTGWILHRSTEGPIPATILDLSRNGFGARGLVRATRERWSWDLGGSVERQRDDRKNFVNNQGVSGALTLDQLETVLATGVFAQARVQPVERLHLSAALRWDRFKFRADDRFVRTTAPTDPDDSGTRTMSGLNPSAGVLFEAVPERLSLFANVATSLETPTTTELVNRPTGAGGFNPELEPTRGVSGEVGFRGALGARLRYEADVYYVRLRDELVPFELAAGRTFYRNAGSSRHKGFEAMVEARPIDGVRMRLSHSRLSARFREYVVGNPPVDRSGNRIPGLAPSRWEGVLGLERGPAFIELSGERMDSISANDANTFATPRHTLLELRGGFEVDVAGLELAPFAGVNNLTDEQYVTSLVVNAFGGRFFEPGPRRWYHVGMRAAWSRR